MGGNGGQGYIYFGSGGDNGKPGQLGSQSSFGLGGTGGVKLVGSGPDGAIGGNGGGYAQNGIKGGDTPTFLPGFIYGGLGGAPGNAVRRNGFTASITGGTVLGPIN